MTKTFSREALAKAFAAFGPMLGIFAVGGPILGGFLMPWARTGAGHHPRLRRCGGLNR